MQPSPPEAGEAVEPPRKAAPRLLSNNFFSAVGSVASPSSGKDDAASKRRPTATVSPLSGLVDEVAANKELGAIGSSFMTFERCRDVTVNKLMGRSLRSHVTGLVTLNTQISWPDFDIVDVWTRSSIRGRLRQFREDPHLFQAVPLSYRTWLYHEMFLHQRVMRGGDAEFGMVKQALEARCIDADISGGRWSPLMTYGPMLLVLSLAGDMIVVLASIILLLSMSGLGHVLNRPRFYRATRVASMPVRLAFLVLLCVRCVDFTPVGTLAFVISMGVAIYDFVRGDMHVAFGYRYECTYEILKILPNRVFLCKRYGAAPLDSFYTKHSSPPETITGVGAWQPDLHLIADFAGVLAELRPMTTADWTALFDEYSTDHRRLTFTGLDVFEERYPCIEALSASMDRRLELAERFRRALGPDSLLYNPADRDWLEALQPRAAVWQKKASARPYLPGAVMVETDL